MTKYHQGPHVCQAYVHEYVADLRKLCAIEWRVSGFKVRNDLSK